MLTTDEVADAMRVTPQTLRHMVAVGDFPEPFRRGRPWTWAPATVDAVLAGEWTPGAAPSPVRFLAS
jgi:hypothetical protein